MLNQVNFLRNSSGKRKLHSRNPRIFVSARALVVERDTDKDWAGGGTVVRYRSERNGDGSRAINRYRIALSSIARHVVTSGFTHQARARGENRRFSSAEFCKTIGKLRLFLTILRAVLIFLKQQLVFRRITNKERNKKKMRTQVTLGVWQPPRSPKSPAANNRSDDDRRRTLEDDSVNNKPWIATASRVDGGRRAEVARTDSTSHHACRRRRLAQKAAKQTQHIDRHRARRSRSHWRTALPRVRRDTRVTWHRITWHRITWRARCRRRRRRATCDSCE